jgi:hypothetical protein
VNKAVAAGSLIDEDKIDFVKKAGGIDPRAKMKKISAALKVERLKSERSS